VLDNRVYLSFDKINYSATSRIVVTHTGNEKNIFDRCSQWYL